MSNLDDPRLYGLPPESRHRWAKYIPQIKDRPEFLLQLGSRHMEQHNWGSAAECWGEAMLQTTKPIIQCTAARMTLEAVSQGASSPFLSLAVEILQTRASEGNSEAIKALQKYVKPSRYQM